MSRTERTQRHDGARFIVAAGVLRIAHLLIAVRWGGRTSDRSASAADRPAGSRRNLVEHPFISFLGWKPGRSVSQRTDMRAIARTVVRSVLFGKGLFATTGARRNLFIELIRVLERAHIRSPACRAIGARELWFPLVAETRIHSAWALSHDQAGQPAAEGAWLRSADPRDPAALLFQSIQDNRTGSAGLRASRPNPRTFMAAAAAHPAFYELLPGSTNDPDGRLRQFVRDNRAITNTTC